MQYLAAERRNKSPDVFVVRGLYEQSITEVEKRRFAGEGNAEHILRTFWLGYIDFLVRERRDSLFHVFLRLTCHRLDQRIQGVDEGDLVRVIKRATRSVPGSGEVWARYIRHLVRRTTDHGSVYD